MVNKRGTTTRSVHPSAATPYDAGMGDVTRVLVVDDEPTIREVVTRYLEREGFIVDAAATGTEAMSLVGERPPDLVVLDLMLPGITGIEVLAGIRRTSDIPIILLTARSDEVDRVAGLELGADDYVVKPFSPRELAARVRSVLRRTARPETPNRPIRFDGFEIDPMAREITRSGEKVRLTAREFDLLSFLAGSPRQVFSRNQLLNHVWDSSADWQDPSTVTVHIRRLRNKIEVDPQAPDHLVTVRGVGYRFEP
jgi:DNA-binding response OmpR family regulator